MPPPVMLAITTRRRSRPNAVRAVIDGRIELPARDISVIVQFREIVCRTELLKGFVILADPPQIARGCDPEDVPHLMAPKEVVEVAEVGAGINVAAAELERDHADSAFFEHPRRTR